MRRLLTWASIQSTTTHVPDQDLVVAVDAALDAGKLPDMGIFKKLVVVKVQSEKGKIEETGKR